MSAPPTLTELQARVLAFAEARDWSRYHSPRNLAMALVVEASDIAAVVARLVELAKEGNVPAAREVLEAEPRLSADGKRLLGEIAQQAQDFEAAARYFEAALVIKPDFAEAHVGVVARDIREKTGVEVSIANPFANAALNSSAVVTFCAGTPMPCEMDTQSSAGLCKSSIASAFGPGFWTPTRASSILRIA